MTLKDIDLTLFTSDPKEIKLLTQLLENREEPISNFTIRHLLKEIRKED